MPEGLPRVLRFHSTRGRTFSALRHALPGRIDGDEGTGNGCRCAAQEVASRKNIHADTQRLT